MVTIKNIAEAKKNKGGFVSLIEDDVPSRTYMIVRTANERVLISSFGKELWVDPEKLILVNK